MRKVEIEIRAAAFGTTGQEASLKTALGIATQSRQRYVTASSPQPSPPEEERGRRGGCAEGHTKSPAARPRGFDATGDSKIATPQYLAPQGFSPVRCLELFAALCHSFFLFERSQLCVKII
jgi:hypothetical protein